MEFDLGLVMNQLVWGVMVGVGFTLMAMAFSLIFSTSNMINFAIGEFAMLAAYFCYTALSHVPGGFVGAALVSMVGIAAFGMLVERIAFRRLYKLDHILVLIGTIGLSAIIKNLTLIIFGPYAFSFPQYFSPEPIIIGSLILIPQNVIVALVGVVVLIVFQIFMKYTRLGLAMRATAENFHGATLVGINTARCVNLSWGLGAVLAGIAGTMMGFAYNISIDMGGTLGLKGFTSAIFGGFGSLPASAAGGVLMGVLENASALVFDYTYKDIVAFVIIVLILLFRPAGLFLPNKGVRRV